MTRKWIEVYSDRVRGLFLDKENQELMKVILYDVCVQGVPSDLRFVDPHLLLRCPANLAKFLSAQAEFLNWAVLVTTKIKVNISLVSNQIEHSEILLQIQQLE